MYICNWAIENTATSKTINASPAKVSARPKFLKALFEFAARLHFVQTHLSQVVVERRSIFFLASTTSRALSFFSLATKVEISDF